MARARLCKGCHTPMLRKRLANGRQEQATHFKIRIFHDNHCKLLYSLRRKSKY